MSCIQRGWPSTSAMTSQTRSIGASMTTSELDRLGLLALRCSARIAVERHSRCRRPTSAEPDGPADHRITVATIATPAASHLVERAVAVARLEVHGRDRVGQDGGPEAEPDRIERGRLDAVVGREPDDDDVARSPASRSRASSSVGDRLAGHRVAHREAGVAVLAVGALADPRRVVGECQVRDGAPRPTCRRRSGPATIPPSLAKWGVRSGCQSWVATTSAPLAWPPSRSRGRWSG